MIRVAAWVGGFVALAALPFFLGSYHNDVYRKLLLWITLALGYNFLFGISGQIALDPRTGTFDSDASIEVQTQRVLDNVRAILESNQLTMANIVSVTVYLSNLGNLVAMDRAYQAYFRQTLPARSVVEVAKLPRGALVEISAIAGR